MTTVMNVTDLRQNDRDSDRKGVTLSTVGSTSEFVRSNMPPTVCPDRNCCQVATLRVCEPPDAMRD